MPVTYAVCSDAFTAGQVQCKIRYCQPDNHRLCYFQRDLCKQPKSEPAVLVCMAGTFFVMLNGAFVTDILPNTFHADHPYSYRVRHCFSHPCVEDISHNAQAAGSGSDRSG